MSKSVNYELAYKVKCPQCNAEPKKPCITVVFNAGQVMKTFHSARYAAAGCEQWA